MSDTSSRTKATQYTKWSRRGPPQAGDPLWTDPDHMTFTRVAAPKMDPDPAGITTNVLTMVLLVGLVAGLLSLTF